MACISINMFNSDHQGGFYGDAASAAPPMNGPRISFSSDFNMEPPPPRSQGPPPDPDFEFAVGSRPMAAADQLFYEGRLLPLKDSCRYCGGPQGRTTTLREELLGDGQGERPPRGPTKWKGLLALRKAAMAAKKGDKTQKFSQES